MYKVFRAIRRGVYVAFMGIMALLFMLAAGEGCRSYWVVDGVVIGKSGRMALVTPIEGVLAIRIDPCTAQRLCWQWKTYEPRRLGPSVHTILRQTKPSLAWMGFEAGWAYGDKANGYYTIRLPLWMPSVLTGLPLLWGVVRWYRKHHPRPLPGHCRKCNYDLRAHKPGDRCPECGSEVLAKTA